MQFLIDIQAKILEGKGSGYARWAKKFNLNQAAEALFFAQDHNLCSLTQLSELAVAHTEKSEVLLASIKADETRLQEIAVLKTHLINYARSKDVFAQYKAFGYSRDFFEANREVLTLRRATSKAFREYEQQHAERRSILEKGQKQQFQKIQRDGKLSHVPQALHGRGAGHLCEGA